MRQVSAAMNQDALTMLLRQTFPGLLAVYAFGSQVAGDASKESDLDLAVFLPGYVEAETLWELSGKLADFAGCPVDLLDFRAASTVMQYRILTTGERWWAANAAVDTYEAAVLSDKLELDEARAPLLADIQREGRIHGG